MRHLRTTCTRWKDEERGFTLIELLIVLVILAILLALALPSYLGFVERSRNRTAQANLRTAATAAEAYYSDYDTYVGMTPVALRSIDSGLDPGLAVSGTTATGYCIGVSNGPQAWSLRGPGTSTNWHKGNLTCAGASGPPTGT